MKDTNLEEDHSAAALPVRTSKIKKMAVDVPQTPEESNTYPDQSNLELQPKAQQYPSYPVEVKSPYNINQEDEDLNIQINTEMRNGFIRKVYGLLSIQLFITVLVIFIFQLPIIKSKIFNNIQYQKIFGSVLIFCAFFFLFLFLCLICCRDLARKVPYNYVFLSLITLCESMTCGIIAACYSFEIVLISLVLTTVATLAISIYACTTKKDFSYPRLVLMVIFSQFLVFGFLRFFFFRGFHLATLLYCLVGTVFVGFYLIYDTQLILGKFGRSYAIDDYVFATVELYVDIIRLFLEILRIVALMSNRRR